MNGDKTKTVSQSLADLTSLTARISDVFGRTQLPDIASIQTSLSGAIWRDFSPIDYKKDTVLGGGSLSALAAMEAQTKEFSSRIGLAQITSVAKQLSTISEMLSAQTAFIKELIAPSSMLADLQRIAEQTHKSIINAGALSSWQVDVLDCASFMVDRHIDWSSHFYTTAFEEEAPSEIEERDVVVPRINLIESLPEELDYEKLNNEVITTRGALERTNSFKMSERGKRLAERIVNINKLCKRKNLAPIFRYTDATFLASSTLSGTICTNNDNFGNVIDSLYYVFYENLEHIKDFVTDQAVRNEDVYQCIFRVKDIRTDLRHDYEHGKSVSKKMREIAESYSHYAGKMLLTSSDDFKITQERLYDEFYTLTGHLFDVVEHH